MQITRRESFAVALAALPSACGNERRRHSTSVPGQATGKRRAPLDLRPPHLNKPTKIDLDRVQPDSYGNYKLELWGEGRDYVILMPKHQPLPHGLVIDGRNEARNIVIIGGSIQPEATSNLATTKLIANGEYAVYAERGFSGAAGGTFRVQTSESGSFTAALPWNAAPADIASAIDAILGPGAVRAVVGPQAPGGPWKFVPADYRLGRVNLDITLLSGDARLIAGEDVYEAGSTGMTLKDFRGTVHLEGLDIGGPNCNEGIDVQTPYATAAVQVASCHVNVPFFFYNNDWQHPDAMQCYLGPPSLQIERSDLITYGTQALLGQPRQTDVPAPLQLLRDWWFKDVLFQARSNTSHPGLEPGSCCYLQDHWPEINGNAANWHWIMHNCYASRLGLNGHEVQTGTYLLYWNHYPLKPPVGLHIRQTPPGGTFAAPLAGLSGLDYRSPGYTRQSIPLGTARLRGNKKLT